MSLDTDTPNTDSKPQSEMDKTYDPKAVEPRWYQWWQEHGHFKAADTSERPQFSISMPPPNVTGSLHMGHALTATLEDILTRWRRMQGHNALWMPGTDHAGIATQMVVERELSKEGKHRRQFTRDAFIDIIWTWKAKSHARITHQHQRLGISCDWERERFTMDEGLSRAVREVFVQLWEEGLIYRAERLINWSPKMQTVLSDLEVETNEEDGNLWHIAYPVSGTSGERLVVATTRPETMVGDTAVAVHPDDPRYQHLIGQMVDLPLTGRQIPIIADAILVDMAFGTGCVKVTPAHDFNDFETGRRHGLAVIGILTPDCTMNQNAPVAYQGLDRYDARTKIVADLDALGLLVEVKAHKLALGRSQRSGEVVEPMLSKQWYVRTEPLAKEAIRVVEEGEIQIIPEHWTKTYYHWMYNIRDWCISRQLWWGHRIPAWYCGDCSEITVSRTDATQCAHCGSTSSLKQDEDVLDTWFSSALWPFSTLGWPDKTEALKTFYPNSVMETGHDILFFWVARMIMMGCKFMGQVPFKKVYLHAMVRDEKGEKMSKTKGNVIDPLDLVDTHGADALRFTLAALTVAGRSIKLSVDRVSGYRNFANKVWNASRFALMNLEGFDPAAVPDAKSYTIADQWILTRLAEAGDKVDAELEAFDFGGAASTVYHFFWNEVCDWYIELAKVGLDGPSRAATQHTLHHVLDGALRLLHPFMPHLTEEIWQRLPRRPGDLEALIVGPFRGTKKERFPAEAARMSAVIAVIEGIRVIRGENNVPPKKPIDVILNIDAAGDTGVYETERAMLTKLGGIQSLQIVRGQTAPNGAAVARSGDVEVIVPLDGLVDFVEERKRLEKNIVRLDAEIGRMSGKLQNASFVDRAPADVVVKERERLAQTEAERATAVAALERLK